MLQELTFIGSGACGNQVALLSKHNGFSAIAINSTRLDTEQIEGELPVIYIGEEGCGKIRANGKSLVKKNAKEVADLIMGETTNSSIIVVGGSGGGGTGAGSIPITTDLLSSLTDAITIPLIVLPENSEDIRALSNAIETCKEVQALEMPYMLIDNGAYKGSIKDMFNGINKSIVEDLAVLRGDYNTPSQYGNMDVKDCKRLFSTPGLLSINKVTGIKDTTFDSKSFDDIILKSINDSYNVQLEKDKIVKRIGIIISVTDEMLSKFDRNLTGVKKEIGTPLEMFLHINIVDRIEKCGIITILAGMSFPDSRIEEMVEIVEQAKEALNKTTESRISDMNESIGWIDNEDITSSKKPKKSLDDILGNW